ncbi:MAG TPA: hypothetical protein VIG51_07690 [Candidatus Baltobacteraceae bacterium]|jgi:HEAT repeat protein
MPAPLWVVLAIFVIGAALGAYALLAPKRVEVRAPAPQTPLAPVRFSNGDWTADAGAEFASLSESARCDLIFAIGTLEDERSHRLLVHALDDPADGVALAAAHALARNGRIDEVREFAQAHPGIRADTVLQTLALLD